MKELGSYNPLEFEDEMLDKWQSNNAYHAEVDAKKEPFAITMPPPNVTSQAHIGHALDGTFQDVLIRYKRMQGFSALWLPGADHAAIATEIKIVEMLRNEGKTKEQIGRKEFDKVAWAWYTKYGDRIMQQFKRMGFSADWERYRFTMDEKSTDAVLEAFIKLYNEGLIYRGKRQTNWCTHCKSVISDDEVDYYDEQGGMWHIRYPYADGSGYIVVATTRPETMFGDTAVAVNPTDKRYKSIVGKMLRLPLTDREIPIIADSYVEKDFGTGMVKITPAHDPNDYEVGKRHNLEIIEVISKEGLLTNKCGKFSGMEAKEARKLVEEELNKLGLLEKVEKYTHSVGHCYRCKTPIEPMITEQWFVKMKELVKPAINAVKTGDLKIYPKRFEKNYLHWLNNIQDWCISRQIWTGHRIPIYYCDDCKNIMASKTPIAVCSKCGSQHIHQDSDVLDTWFSSALWPFSTLGWPENTKELEYYYPTSVLVTAFDILTQWVTKMVYMGYECAGKVPFRNCLIHGLVRDELGRKMSKSLGNGIDPLDITKTYGADSLRIALIKDMAMGLDTRFSMQKVDNAKAFVNKVWNAAKFVKMHVEGETIKDIRDVELSDVNKWILEKLSSTISQVTKNLDKFDIGLALTNIYNFTWEDFCDWYIEFAKADIYAGGKSKQNTVSVLYFVLENILKMLSPFIPFATEKIYESVFAKNNKDLLMTSSFADYKAPKSYMTAYDNIENLKELIVGIRSERVKNNIPSNKRVKFAVDSQQVIDSYKAFVEKLALVELIQKSHISAPIITKLTGFELIKDDADTQNEIRALEEQIKKLNFEIERSAKMLSNPGFVSKAPEALVQAENKKLENNKNMLTNLESKLKLLK